MNHAAYEDLTPQQASSIRSALKTALPRGPEADIEEDGVMVRNGEYLVPVHAKGYPQEMFEFMQALATAEIKLRDTGLSVRLIPDIKQRMIVIGTVDGRAYAYNSSDGNEYSDLARILQVDESDLSPMGIIGYPYDNELDFEIALKEAQREFPSVDFSGVTFG